MTHFIMYKQYGSTNLVCIAFIIALISSAQCINADDLQFPSKTLKELCLQSNLVFFQQNLQKTQNDNYIQVYGIASLDLIQNRSENTKISDSHLYQNYKGSRAVVITGVMHPREDTAFRFIKQALQKIIRLFRDQDPQIRYLLSRVVLLVVPFVNIDTIKHSLNLPLKQVLQLRKNMNVGDSAKCRKQAQKGVDINRNFDYKFGTQQTSRDPCSQQYHGKQPFSEPQSKSIRTLFQDFIVTTNVDVHSYGNLWIYPYAADLDPNKIMEHRLYPSYQHIFNKFKSLDIQYENCYESLNYLADGVYIDWALQRGSVSWAIQFGDQFYKVGQQMDKQIKGIIQVLKINNAAFQYFLTLKSNKSDSMQSGENANQSQDGKSGKHESKSLTGENYGDKTAHLCIYSKSTIEHNVKLMIKDKQVEQKLVAIGSSLCLEYDINYIMENLDNQDSNVVYLKLGNSQLKQQINLKDLRNKNMKELQKVWKQQQSTIYKLIKDLKIFFIIICILYGLGCLCGLSIFCEKSLGIRMQEQDKQTNNLGIDNQEISVSERAGQMKEQTEFELQVRQSQRQRQSKLRKNQNQIQDSSNAEVKQ